MITKTYRLKFINSYSTIFKVGNSEIAVRFLGTPNTRGVFTTSNEELQKVMESCNSFNKVYAIANTIEQAKEDKSTEEEGVADNEVQLKEVTAKNLQGINDLVKELFPEYGKSFKSSEKAVEYFKERGYNLVIE